MEQIQNPFENITVLQFVGQYHIPREIKMQQLYNRGWWITFIYGRDVCLVRKKKAYKNHISFSCKFLKIYRGIVDERTIKQIERFNEQQWNKYKHIMLEENHETDNQI